MRAIYNLQDILNVLPHRFARSRAGVVPEINQDEQTEKPFEP